nr:hypothetical protein [Tanacetum cinerariifolium]
ESRPKLGAPPPPRHSPQRAPPLAVGEASVCRGWSSNGASSSDGAKYSGYSGSGT